MNEIIAFKDLTEGEVIRLAHILTPFLGKGDFVGLQGNLGAGKSVFARAMIRTAMGNENLDVQSPTYTLVHPYSPSAPYPEILHVDLYRIEDKRELEELGLEDDQEVLLVVEWPERLGHTWEKSGLKILLTDGTDKNTRNIEISGAKSWDERLHNLKLIRTK